MPKKIILTVWSHNTRGRKTKTVATGKVPGDVTLADMKALWEAEQTLNRLSTLRVHVDLMDESDEIAVRPI